MYYAGQDLGKNEDDQEKMCFCNVCKLSFKNQQHYTIHCNGLLHSERLSALYAKTEQNVSAVVAPNSAVAQKNSKVSGYSSYQEPSNKNIRPVAAGRESYSNYSTYDGSYSTSNLSAEEGNEGWMGSETYLTSDSRGRGRSTSVTALAPRSLVGGWDSSSAGNNGSGRTQSLTRAATMGYDDQGYNANADILPESSNTRYAASSLVPEKRSFSAASGLDSGYASVPGKYGSKNTYGYSTGPNSDTEFYGTTGDLTSDKWDSSNVAGGKSASHGYGSVPALTSETYGYDSSQDYGSADHYISNPDLSLGYSGYKSVAKLASEKQVFSSSKPAANQRTYGSSYTSTSGGYGSADTSAYSHGSKVAPVSRDYSSAQELSSDDWNYSSAPGHVAETADEYDYQGSADDAAYGWDQGKNTTSYSETEYGTDAAPQVFDYGHQDCPPEAVDSWADSSGYYDNTQESATVWPKKSDAKQTSSSFKNSGYVQYPTGAGDVGMTSQAKYSRPGTRAEDYGSLSRVSRDIKQNVQDYNTSYEPYSDDSYGNMHATGSRAGNRFAHSSSDKTWSNESLSGSQTSTSDSKRAGRASRWQDAESSSDAAFWTSTSTASNAMRGSSKPTVHGNVPLNTTSNVKPLMDVFSASRESRSLTMRGMDVKQTNAIKAQQGAFNKTLNVPTTTSNSVKTFMDSRTGIRHGSESSYSSSTSHKSSDQRGPLLGGYNSNSSKDLKPSMDTYSGSRRGSEPSFSSSNSQHGKDASKSLQGDGLVRYPALLSQTVLATTRANGTSATSNMSSQRSMSGSFDSSNKSTVSSRDSNIRPLSSSGGFRTPAPIGAGNLSFPNKSPGQIPVSFSSSEFKTPSSVRMSNVQTTAGRTPPNAPPGSSGNLGFRGSSPASTTRSPLLQSSSITSSSPASRFQSSSAPGQVKVTSAGGSSIAASRMSSPAAAPNQVPPFKTTSPVVTPVRGGVSPVRTGLPPASPTSWSARQTSPVNTTTPSGLMRPPVTGNVRTSFASTSVGTPNTATSVRFGTARQTSPAIGTTSSSVYKSPSIVSTASVRTPGVSTTVSSGSVRQPSPIASAGSSPLLRSPGMASTSTVRTPLPLLRTPVSTSNVRSPAIASSSPARTTVPSLMSSGSARPFSATVTASVSPLFKSPVGVSSAAAVRSPVTVSTAGVRPTVSSSVSGFRTPVPLSTSSSPRQVGVTSVAAVSTSSSPSGIQLNRAVQPSSHTTAVSSALSPCTTTTASVRAPMLGSSVRPVGVSSTSMAITTGALKPPTGVSPTSSIRAAAVTLSPSVRTPGLSPSSVRPSGVALSPTVRAPGTAVTPVRSSVVSSSTFRAPSPVVTGVTAGKSSTATVTCSSSVIGSPSVSSSQGLTTQVRTPGSSPVGASRQSSPAVLQRPPVGVSAAAARTPGVAPTRAAGSVTAATPTGSARQQSPTVTASSSPLLRSPASVSTGSVRTGIVSTSTVRTPAPRLASPSSARQSVPAVTATVSPQLTSPNVPVTTVKTPVALLTTPPSTQPSVSSSVAGPRTPVSANVRASSPAVRPGIAPSTLPAWRTPKPVGIASSTTNVRSGSPVAVSSSCAGVKPATSIVSSGQPAKPSTVVVSTGTPTLSTAATVGGQSSGTAVISSAATTSKSGSLALTSSSGSSTAPKAKEVQQQPGSNAQQKEAPKEDSSDQNTKVSVATTGLAGNSASTSVVTSSKSAVTAASALETTATAVVGQAKDDLLARLSTLEPKDLLEEIVSGRVPVNMLDRVTERLPAEMLQQAVDYLTGSDKAKPGTQKSAATVQSSDSAVSTSTTSVAATVATEDSKAGSLKRKLDGFDVSKLKDMKFDDTLALFQQTVQDVLGGIFKVDAKSVAKDNLTTLRSLSAEDRSLVVDMQKTFSVKDLAKVVEALSLLRSLDSGIVEALGRLDIALVKKAMAGNPLAVLHGATALRRLANFVANNKKPMLKVQATEASKSATTTAAAAAATTTITTKPQPSKPQPVATKRPATSVPSLFNAGMPRSQSLQEKKQRLNVPSLLSQTMSRPASGYQAPSRPTLLPNPGVRPLADSRWRQPGAFGVQPAARFRQAGPRGFSRGPTGY